MTDIRQALYRERTRDIVGAVVVAAIVAIIIVLSWNGLHGGAEGSGRRDAGRSAR